MFLRRTEQNRTEQNRGSTMQMTRKSAYMLLLSLAMILSSCQKDLIAPQKPESQSEEVNPRVKSTGYTDDAEWNAPQGTPTVLGSKLENPYSVENMQIVADMLTGTAPQSARAKAIRARSNNGGEGGEGGNDQNDSAYIDPDNPGGGGGGSPIYITATSYYVRFLPMPHTSLSKVFYLMQGWIKVYTKVGRMLCSGT